MKPLVNQDQDLETANRIAALCIFYREDKPQFLEALRRRQEAERTAREQHDWEALDDLSESRP